MKACTACPYSELFWSVFSRVRTEHGEILRIYPYSVRMWENTDQHNSEYGHFLRIGVVTVIPVLLTVFMGVWLQFELYSRTK